MQGVLIETPEALKAAVEHALGQERLAIDLEGDGYFRYRPRVCTLQMNLGDRIVVVDTLKCWESPLLAQLLGPEGPQKVLHDAAFDARLLWAQGVALGHVFDTALAARLLGDPATGLASQLRQRCGVSIEKDQQQADWGRRPLDKRALRYLHDDVLHLFDLADSLQQDLEASGIEGELQVESDYVLAQARQAPPPAKPPWVRIKGSRKLAPVAQATLREVAAMRERLAEDWNVPPFRVAHDRLLLTLATKRPAELGQLKAVKGLLRGRGKGLGPAWLAAVARGVRAGAVPAEELRGPDTIPSADDRARRKRLEKALSRWRAAEAETRGVDIQVVLPGHGLQALVSTQPANREQLDAIDGLGEVRLVRYADAWLELVARSEVVAEASEDAP